MSIIHEGMGMIEPPTIEALLTPSGSQVVLPCPYCKEWHFHGSADGDPDGHRVSHCLDRKLDTGNGYIVKVIGKASPEFMNRIRRKGNRPVSARAALA